MSVHAISRVLKLNVSDFQPCTVPKHPPASLVTSFNH